MIAPRVEAAPSCYPVLAITRPLNCLMASVSVAVGAFLAGHGLSYRSGLAAAMTFLVCAGAYVINDIFDVAADRLVKPGRPLAGGLVAPSFAVKYAIGLWAGAAALATLAGRVGLIFYLAWTVVLWLYSCRLKGQGIYGHLLVSLVASSGFVLGAAAEGRVLAGWVPAAIAVVFHLAREIAKGVADVAGDRAVGVRTLAVRIGPGAALGTVAWLGVGCALVSLAPAVARAFGPLYLPVVLAGVFPLLAVSLWRIAQVRLRGADPVGAARSVAVTLKLAMVAGLVAFFLGGI